MTRMARTLALAALLLTGTIAGCGSDPTPVDGGPLDGGGLDAGASDAGPSDAGTTDAGTTDASLDDAGAGDAGALDGGGADAGPTLGCEAAGGACVAVVPGACMDGIVGNADWYSCGGGLGVLCCLPARTPPSCRAIGTRSEGWYEADGTRICFASCEGAALECRYPGTRSEGWYTSTAGAACSDPPVTDLVQWADCTP